ncbi:MAG: GNAT family N-acetyltransferase [Candidatus Riflebacteria bacterium]|nr:GNAT family N-acetyltransferase [Candidatus Riflebacteria bacterium]
MALLIRPLTSSDFEAAESILNSAFSRPTNRRLVLEWVVKISPNSCFLALLEGMPVGMVAAICFQRMAWVGLMAVDPKWQSRGFGKAIMTHVLAHLEGQGTNSILLDASAAGRPLYKSMGFVEADESRMFERNLEQNPFTVEEKNSVTGGSILSPEEISIRIIAENDLQKLSGFDAFAYGTNREGLLKLLYNEFSSRCLLAKDVNGEIIGYVCAQKNRIGPWIATQEMVAERLLQSALLLPFEQPVQIIAPEKNTCGKDVLLRNGFIFSYANRHMWKGEMIPQEKRQFIYGQGNFAYG